MSGSHVRASIAVLALAAAAAHVLPLSAQHPPAGPRFEIAFAANARSEPVTGMVYVAISRDNKTTPIQQADTTGTPLFAKYVDQLKPGAGATIGIEDRGHPVASLKDLPAGDYWVQPFVNVYTRFARADGHVVWLHMDQWEGQNWKRSPGNLYGDPVRMRIDPRSEAAIRLVADKVMAPITVAPDTDFVKRIKIQSDILTTWHPNAYFIENDRMKVERLNRRRPDGNIVSMMKDENQYELVVGDQSRSGGQ
jgi:hypothetical protein